MWTKEFCQTDSDGDGQTNGFELGDPCCLWTQGDDSALRLTQLSHPGDASQTSDAAPTTCPADKPSPPPPATRTPPASRSPRPKPSKEIDTISTAPQPSSSPAFTVVVDRFSPSPEFTVIVDVISPTPHFSVEVDILSPEPDIPLSSSGALPNDANSPTPSFEALPNDVNSRTPSAEEPTPDPEDDEVCFPAQASVTLSDGSTRAMRDVQVGDEVLVAPGTFSKVFMFTHRVPTARHAFLTITAEAATLRRHSISLTHGHFLYINGLAAMAASVALGDKLLLGSGVEARVVAVQCALLDGLYNPQTLHGDIVVDGVLASTYTKTVEEVTAHSMLAPLRALFRSTGVWTGVLEDGARGGLQRFVSN